jgi:hypothetical protein
VEIAVGFDWSFVGIRREFELEEVVDIWLGGWLDFGFGSIWRTGTHRFSDMTVTDIVV